MGKKPKQVIRVVLDTNVIVSAMLFSGSPAEFLRMFD
jgi:predicted nucleic acid-binding protein